MMQGSLIINIFSAKICEISAVSIGMIVGIIALFSGIVERKGTNTIDYSSVV